MGALRVRRPTPTWCGRSERRRSWGSSWRSCCKLWPPRPCRGGHIASAHPTELHHHTDHHHKPTDQRQRPRRQSHPPRLTVAPVVPATAAPPPQPPHRPPPTLCPVVREVGMDGSVRVVRWYMKMVAVTISGSGMTPTAWAAAGCCRARVPAWVAAFGWGARASRLSGGGRTAG